MRCGFRPIVATVTDSVESTLFMNGDGAGDIVKEADDPLVGLRPAACLCLIGGGGS